MLGTSRDSVVREEAWIPEVAGMDCVRRESGGNTDWVSEGINVGDNVSNGGTVVTINGPVHVSEGNTEVGIMSDVSNVSEGMAVICRLSVDAMVSFSVSGGTTVDCTDSEVVKLGLIGSSTVGNNVVGNISIDILDTVNDAGTDIDAVGKISVGVVVGEGTTATVDVVVGSNSVAARDVRVSPGSLIVVDGEI